MRAAQFSLGWPYYQGGEAAAGTVAIDKPRAARWLSAAADAGHPMASYLIGRMHLEGAAGLPADAAPACALLVQLKSAPRDRASAGFRRASVRKMA